MPDLIPGVGVVLVGAVLHVGNMVKLQIILDFPAGGGEQGADQPPLAGADAGEALETGAPDEMEEDGLSVVVGGVGGGDPVCTHGPRGLLQKGIPHPAGGLFQAQAQALCLPGDVSSTGDEPDGREGGLARGWVWATPVLHPALHKGLVPVGLGAPKMMVIVGGHQGEGTYRPQLVEPVEQTDGIRSAGDRTDHGTPRRQHIIFVYEPIHGTVRALIHNQYS